MKFSVQLPTDRVERGEEYTSASAITEMAKAIESAGFDADDFRHVVPAFGELICRVTEGLSAGEQRTDVLKNNAWLGKIFDVANVFF